MLSSARSGQEMAGCPGDAGLSWNLPSAQAMGNLLRRMLEASGRGMWQADARTLDQLKQMYGDLQDKLEGV